MDVGEWQNRLTDTFGPGGASDSLLRGVRQEQSYRRWVGRTWRGHNLLMRCFFSHYYETIEVATRDMHSEGWWREDEAYRSLHLMHVSNFKGLRAAHNTFLSGYPLDAAGLLRDLKDRAVFLAAVARGITSIHDLYYVPPVNSPPETLAEARSQRIREQGRVLGLMLRGRSGLPPQTVLELERWEQLFHFEVHGSMLTRGYTATQMLRTKRFSLWPLPESDEASMYMCREGEVAWMLTRLLPLLQTSARAFGEEWAHRWDVLDESFRYYSEDLGKIGKPIGYAIIELVDRKFPFKPDTCSADGSCVEG